jgi:hypothetical protein
MDSEGLYSVQISIYRDLLFSVPLDFEYNSLSNYNIFTGYGLNIPLPSPTVVGQQVLITNTDNSDINVLCDAGQTINGNGNVSLSSSSNYIIIDTPQSNTFTATTIKLK